MKTQDFISEENSHLEKFRKIVQDSIEAEELIVYNLLHPPTETLSDGQKISDKVAKFGGSWRFIITFAILLSIWIIFYTFITLKFRFDPYPFILMNLILSSIAALQAPIIMMSQNRQEEKDRMMNENDYLINLKAEMQIRSLHQKIDLLLEEQIKTLFESQKSQLDMLKNINTQLEKM
ncbi:MAG: DUF1003 domain-containing protein [Leadbetterella sp.]|nr:DUF1003 domain-containing protein [Leadbetterella sp.]